MEPPKPTSEAAVAPVAEVDTAACLSEKDIARRTAQRGLRLLGLVALGAFLLYLYFYWFAEVYVLAARAWPNLH